MFKLKPYLLIALTLIPAILIPAGIPLMTDSRAASTDLPLQYALNSVTISLLHQTAHGMAGSYQITLRGDGNSTFSRNNKTQLILTIDKKNWLELINEFYRIHFFELSDTYNVKQQVLLKEEHTLATIATKMVDTDSKLLCIQIADYKKCITIVDKQPIATAQLVKMLEKLMEH